MTTTADKEVKAPVAKGELSANKRKVLEKKHGKLIEIEVEMDDEGQDVALGYFKKPGLQIMSIVMRYVAVKADKSVSITDYEKFTNLIVENTWVGGDERIRQDEMAAFAAASKVFSKIQRRTARIKNS